MNKWMKLAMAAMTAMVLGTATQAQATPVYVGGNECPGDPLNTALYDRQYYVTTATRCVFDAAVANIQGSTANANLFLNNAAAQPQWGTGWVGLGSTGTANGTIAGFTFTKDAGNDDGLFQIGAALAAAYGQFAIGIKDGGTPKWAIFQLAPGVLAGGWGFSTENGDLSHLTLFARNSLGPCIGPDCPVIVPVDIDPVPEPGTLVLLGTGMLAAARKYRKKHAAKV